MAPRLGLLAVPLALLALVPATAGAASRPSATVKLTDCDTDAATATWESQIRAVRGATRMQVRFTLQARSAEQPAWAPVSAPGFDTWLSAKPGKASFLYDKTLTGLTPGAYRVLVRFRWRDEAGETVQRATRRARTCVQPDPRPDLSPRAIEPDGDRYAITVANLGLQRAPASTVALRVGAGAPVLVPVRPLDPQERLVVTARGPACAPGQTAEATVDPDDAVDEADETGNVLTVTCA